MNGKRIFPLDSLIAVFVFTAIVLFPFGFSVKAQELPQPQILVDITRDNPQTGRIEIYQPGQLDNLLKMHIANNKMQKGIPGYRIRIFSQSGQPAKQNAENAKASFMKNFPGINAYLGFTTPNYQIYVGDYRTKTEALRDYKKIEKFFPAAFIVSEIINISR
jgi:hypothetical protein